MIAMKKKTNPQKVPFTLPLNTLDAMMQEVSKESMFETWLCAMSALSDFNFIDQQALVSLWKLTDELSNAELSAITKRLSYIANLTGIPAHIELVDYTSVKTNGDLHRFQRKIHLNEFWSTLVQISSPILDLSMLPEDDFCSFWKRSVANHEELIAHSLCTQEFQEMLAEEYQIGLQRNDVGIYLTILPL